MIKKVVWMLVALVIVAGCAGKSSVPEKTQVTSTVKASSSRTVSTTLRTETVTTIRSSIVPLEEEKDKTVERSETAPSVPPLNEEQSDDVVQSSTRVSGEHSEIPRRTLQANLDLGYEVIVNKKYVLPASYSPGEDVKARIHLLELITRMQSLGFDISNSYSGYRSYYVQENLYNQKVSQVGVQEADRYVARAGHSEHQTGLAYDLKTTDGALLGDGNVEQQAEAIAWVAENAHQYGFIVRYPAGKEHVTGYVAQPWHLRYVGSVEVATNIYKTGLTMEEYYGVLSGGYDE